MIKISPHSKRNLNSICAKHFDCLEENLLHKLNLVVDDNYHHRNFHWKTREAIKTKLDGISSGSESKLSDFARHLLFKTSQNEYPNLKKIIVCLPDDFTPIHQEISSTFHFGSDTDGVLESIFDFDQFSRGVTNRNGRYSAFDLVHSLAIPTCPYCNRQYITASDKRPPLDHFYSQRDFPYFSLSFYNLIPSCGFCNTSFKRDRRVTTEEYVHPYKEGFGENAIFKYMNMITFETKLVIDEPDSQREKRLEQTSELFKIDKVYKSHKDIAKEIYVKSLRDSAAHKRSLEAIVRLLKEISFSDEEFYQFYFGNYMAEEDHEKRPLAKFTSDLVDELGFMRRKR